MTEALTISVIVPVYNTPADVLAECIRSVQLQSYQNFELCICDDCSNSEETLEVLRKTRGTDCRIRIITSPSNLHISRASNFAAEHASGQFLLFLDHDDTLAPDALAEIVRAIEDNPEIDLLYSDEDKIDFDGSYCEPYFKPDWSPENLLSVMYVLHPLVIRKSLFFLLGGFRDEFSGSQDHDLALRASRKARFIHHIPKILYHWRKIEGSASAELEAKPYALDASRRAVIDHLRAQGSQFEVADGHFPGSHRVRYKIPPKTPVTLVILTHDISRVLESGKEINLVRNTVRSIAENTTYKHYRLLVVDDSNISDESRRLITDVGGKIVAYKLTGAFNYPAKLNFSLSQVKTNQVIILNDDLEIITPDWIESLLEWSVRKEIGAVGARLLYPNDTVQHAGVVVGTEALARHAFHKMPREQLGYYGFTHIIRNYSAVTAAVMATRMEVVKQVNGFDERFAVDFNDIDFCLKVRAAGYRIVLNPFCELYHLEGSSLKRDSRNPAEAELFKARWWQAIERDPYMNYPAIYACYPDLI